MLRSKEINYVIVVMFVLLVMAVLTSFGCTGSRGEPGNDGIKGDKGAVGSPGAPAPITAVSIRPLPPGMDCANGGSLITLGTSDTIVCNGEDGTDGSDASVQFVQLCQGTTVYPSTFNELAMCIGGKLYAVYSANNGFLVQLPPGQYQSNGINSSCTFTVVSGCTIQ